MPFSRWRDKTYRKCWLDVPQQSLARCPQPKWKQKKVLPWTGANAVRWRLARLTCAF